MNAKWDTTKEAFIQWKGTDVCMDLHCPKCGHHNHYDGFFAYAVECAKCKAVWKMSWYVSFRAADPSIEDDKHWIKSPLRCELDEAEDVPTPAQS